MKHSARDFSTRQQFAVMDLLEGYLADYADGGPVSFDLMVAVIGNNSMADWPEIIDWERDWEREYQWFLRTRYWFIISCEVKSRAGGRCSICGKNKHLQTHHRSYEHHWDEHRHFEDLICLCSGCHGKFHKKLPKAPR